MSNSDQTNVSSITLRSISSIPGFVPNRPLLKLGEYPGLRTINPAKELDKPAKPRRMKAYRGTIQLYNSPIKLRISIDEVSEGT